MNKIILISFSLLVVSCLQNERADKLIFEDTYLADSLMNRQSVIMKRIQKPDSIRAVSWKIVDSSFVLNEIDNYTVSLNENLILKGWGTQKEDYEFLRNSAYILNEEGICGALEIGYPKKIGFLYMCDQKGFDSKERLILLKDDGYDDELISNIFKTILDENESMVLGY